jgi:hypothetical protein
MIGHLEYSRYRRSLEIKEMQHEQFIEFFGTQFALGVRGS